MFSQVQLTKATRKGFRQQPNRIMQLRGVFQTDAPASWSREDTCRRTSSSVFQLERSSRRKKEIAAPSLPVNVATSSLSLSLLLIICQSLISALLDCCWHEKSQELQSCVPFLLLFSFLLSAPLIFRHLFVSFCRSCCFSSANGFVWKRGSSQRTSLITLRSDQDDGKLARQPVCWVHTWSVCSVT